MLECRFRMFRCCLLEVDEHEGAFGSGKVDAVVTFEPVRSRLLARGAVQIFDRRQIPGEIIHVLVMRTDAMTQFSSTVLTL